MSKAIINNTEFELYSYYPAGSGVSVKLLGTSIDAIEAAARGGATVQVGDEYKGYDLELASITKEYEDGSHRVEFRAAGLEKKVEQNTADIEIANDAIAELAEIIGG